MSSPVSLVVIIGILLAACQRAAESEAVQPPGSTSPIELPASTPAASTEETCVDQWLAARKLDAYGSPEGTLYAGGSPLFDESTGTTTPRLDFIYARHPEARDACGQRASPWEAR
jgi:hypothetical protein